jgi:hypothetical protein
VVAGDVGDRVAQLTDDEGRLFTLDERVPEGADSEVREGPFIAADGVRLPDMDVVIACPFECRWADLVVRVAGAVARVADVPTWVWTETAWCGLPVPSIPGGCGCDAGSSWGASVGSPVSASNVEAAAP